jgi:hypothetical protein
MASLPEDKIGEAITALLDLIDEDNKGRPDFEPSVPREHIHAAIDALAWLYGTRQGSSASIYASLAVTKAIEEHVTLKSQS